VFVYRALLYSYGFDPKGRVCQLDLRYAEVTIESERSLHGQV